MSRGRRPNFMRIHPEAKNGVKKEKLWKENMGFTHSYDIFSAIEDSIKSIVYEPKIAIKYDKGTRKRRNGNVGGCIKTH